MSDIDDQGARPAYAAELGEEWTEVEPGIFVRVDRLPRLSVIPDAPSQTREEAS